jgi:hypothetical protein
VWFIGGGNLKKLNDWVMKRWHLIDHQFFTEKKRQSGFNFTTSA